MVPQNMQAESTAPMELSPLPLELLKKQEKLFNMHGVTSMSSSAINHGAERPPESTKGLRAKK